MSANNRIYEELHELMKLDIIHVAVKLHPLVWSSYQGKLTCSFHYNDKSDYVLRVDGKAVLNFDHKMIEKIEFDGDLYRRIIINLNQDPTCFDPTTIRTFVN